MSGGWQDLAMLVEIIEPDDRRPGPDVDDATKAVATPVHVAETMVIDPALAHLGTLAAACNDWRGAGDRTRGTQEDRWAIRVSETVRAILDAVRAERCPSDDEIEELALDREDDGFGQWAYAMAILRGLRDGGHVDADEYRSVAEFFTEIRAAAAGFDDFDDFEEDEVVPKETGPVDEVAERRTRQRTVVTSAASEQLGVDPFPPLIAFPRERSRPVLEQEARHAIAAMGLVASGGLPESRRERRRRS